MTVTDFDDLTVRRMQSCLDNCVKAEQPFLPVTIMSPGGDVYSMFALIDLMTCGPVPCATIAVGLAMSAGGVLLASGQKGYRFVAPNASVMIHRVSGRPPASNVAGLKEDVRLLEEMDARMLTHLDKASGHRKGYWEGRLAKLAYTDLTMSAEEAVKAGLADHVGIPTIALEETVRVTMTMPETIKKLRGAK